MYQRAYVRIATETSPEGSVMPLWLEFEGRRYEIDRLLEPPRPMAATKAGGIGTRYKVRIRGKVTYLFREDAGRWFVEAKTPAPFDVSISLPTRQRD